MPASPVEMLVTTPDGARNDAVSLLPNERSRSARGRNSAPAAASRRRDRGGGDSRLDPHRLGRYAEVADRLLRYEFVDSAEQAAPWIASQCNGDWILRIDGDEVMSPALIERLPELTGARDVFQYWLPCRWLFPDAEHYLAQPPWHYSSPRLVRNDPATRWHAGLSHGRFEPVFPSVHLSDGYYHLTLLVKDLAHREAKIAHYLSIQSGHSRRVLEDDVTAFYLPRARPEIWLAPVPVPARDRAAIAEVLTASGEERPGPPAEETPRCGAGARSSVSGHDERSQRRPTRVRSRCLSANRDSMAVSNVWSRCASATPAPSAGPA